MLKAYSNPHNAVPTSHLTWLPPQSSEMAQKDLWRMESFLHCIACFVSLGLISGLSGIYWNITIAIYVTLTQARVLILVSK